LNGRGGRFESHSKLHIFSSYNFLKQSCANINDIVIRNFTYEYNRADIALANFAQFCFGKCHLTRAMMISAGQSLVQCIYRKTYCSFIFVIIHFDALEI
jgi:hypothetical protein